MYKKLLLTLVLLWIAFQSGFTQTATFTLKTMNWGTISGVIFSSISKTQWGDIDNDNLLDVMVSGTVGGTAYTYIYHNMGNSTFTQVTRVATPYGIFVDFDKDNYTDFVYYNQTAGQYYWLRNNQDGTFATAARLFSGLTSTITAPTYFCIKDFNNDGYFDILYYTNSNIYLLKNVNNTSYTTGTSISQHSSSSIFLCADFDNNGATDILVRRTSAMTGGIGTTLLSNNGAASFTERHLTTTDNDLLGIGDFHGQGKIDFITEPKDLTAGNVAVFDNNNNFTRTVVANGGVAVGQAFAGNVDNNLTNDLLVFCSGTTNVPLYTQNENGTFTINSALVFGLGTATDSGTDYVEDRMPFGDFDNDGDLDILLGNNLYINNLNTRSVPNPPTNLRITMNGTTLTLKWDASTSTDVTYNIYLTVDGRKVISPQSDIATGYRRVLQLGNAGTSKQFIINGLSANSNFEWGVQAVNNAYVGSVFANSTNLLVYVTPTADQRIQSNLDGIPLVAAEYPVAESRQWKYGTSTIAYDQTIVGATNSVYTPNFDKVGTYYVVCESKKFGETFLSDPVKIVVFAPEINLKGISTSPFLLTPSLLTTATISYSTIGTYKNNNTFKVYLSDKDGSFANQTLLTSTTSQTATILTTNFADQTPSGKGYKIKIVSDFPEVTSNESTTFEIILNHKPTAIVPSKILDIDENSTVGTVVATLTATDIDPNELHTFTLLSGNENFVIEGTDLKATKTFDYETQNRYTVSIKVTDRYNEFYIQSFDISVNNVNEPPTLTLPSQTFKGKELYDISLTGFVISDVDASNEKIQFSVSTQNGYLKFTNLNDNEIVAGKRSSGQLAIQATLPRANEILNSMIFNSERYFYGTASITINVSDLGSTGKAPNSEIGLTTTQLLTINVVALPPYITTQPQALIKGCMNQRVPFGVVVDGAKPITYQWYHRNDAGEGILYSEKSATLWVDITSLDSSGEYYCIISNPSPDNTTSTSGVLALRPQEISASTENKSLCSGDKVATISVNATGGWGDYTYAIDGINFSKKNVYEKLAEGVYYISIKDANDCLSVQEFSIVMPPLLKPNVSQVDVTCKDYNDGKMLVNVLGGTPPFKLEVLGKNLSDPNIAFPTNTSLKQYLNLQPGIYSVNILDKNQCDTFAIITITEPEYIVFTSQQTLPLCYGDSNGAIDFTVKGGTPPYNFYWTNHVMTNLVKEVESGSYSLTEVAKTVGIPAGNYQFYITDTHACSTTEYVLLDQPKPLQVTLQTTQSGTSLSVVGGTPSYQYSDDGRSFVSSNLFPNLTSGYRQFTVRDAHFCSTSFVQYASVNTTSLTQTSSPDANFSFIANLNHATFKNSSINATSYYWEFGDGSTSNQENPTYSYTKTGNYTVRLTAYSENGISIKEKLITVTAVTCVGDEAKNSFKVYPNPTQDQFTVSIADLNNAPQLTLFDSSARKIWEVSINQNVTIFSITKLAKGIYTLQLKTNTKLSTQKLVIY